jgi:3-carboxy-cis,cis-muconate cycloisomerase
MRPSSSRSELFDGVLARGAAAGAVGDEAWLAALLRTEAALARAQAAVGLIPPGVAAAIEAACAQFEPDVAALSADAAGSGNPVVPLVAALRKAVPPDVAESVHKGATSQDIMDTAAMLVTRDALGVILTDTRAAADAAAGLARTYRDSALPARTLLRQAVPTTFGLKAAGWMLALDEAAARVASVRVRRLAVQFGGPAGTLGGLDGRGRAVVARLAQELGLAEPVLPWHTDRTRIAEIAGALGELAGVCGKVGRDITLLAQDEVGEVAEGSPGGSSSMAHKRNPVAAVSTVAAAMRAPGLVASLLAAMVHEHERAAGAWHAEWRPLCDLLVATGSAAAWVCTGLRELSVDPAAMQSHVDDLADRLGSTVDTGESAALVDHALAVHEGTP